MISVIPPLEPLPPLLLLQLQANLRRHPDLHGPPLLHLQFLLQNLHDNLLHQNQHLNQFQKNCQTMPNFYAKSSQSNVVIIFVIYLNARKRSMNNIPLFHHKFYPKMVTKSVTTKLCMISYVFEPLSTNYMA